MSLGVNDYLQGNPSVFSDNLARQDFGRRLMLAFKQKNISEGIQWYQAIHMHSRFKDWDVTYPAALGGVTEKVDLMNMILSGDIETACLSIIYGQPDSMTSPIHWVSQERMDWAISEMKKFLGWP